GYATSVDAAAFSFDGKRIVTAGNDHVARIWGALTAQEVAAFRGPDDNGNAPALRPDGKRNRTPSPDPPPRHLDARPPAEADAAEEIAVLRGHESGVASAGFSRDGKRIVTASWDKSARVWNAATATEIALLRGHNDALNCAAFSPDGQFIVSASSDQTARI